MTSKPITCFISVFFLSWLLVCKVVSAQQKPVNNLKNYATALNNIRELKPIEKLYLQTDKPYYSVGDTLRFKGYLLNADYLTPSTNSGLLYVELDNEQGKSAKRIMVPLNSGLAWGYLALDSVDVPNGIYTLRAYTNWMRNFGEDYIFEKTITVSKSNDNPLLVKAGFKQTGNKVEAELVFSLLDGRVQAFKDVELKVMNGKRNLSKDKVVTSADGSVKVNFTVPEGNGALNIQAVTAGSGLLNIPVLLNRKENTDVQFMPEGGQLVAGLPAKVGFKAVAEDGKGVNVSGKVLDSKGQQVAAFASTHAGMGSFEFTPAAGEVYTVKVDGIVKAYTLPLVKPSGTSLAVSSAGDSIRVAVSATSDAKGVYSLIAQARGVVCFAQTVGTPTISVAKKLFPTGIVRFSLLNSNNQAINERIVFINHYDDLRIAIEPHKAAYGIRDSIALAIKVTDKDGKPVEGNFSLAVTDNSQVKPDSLGTNILNNLLLTSDLKGNIENPGYYFMPGKETDLDNLLLTQGWVGYDWQEVFHPKLPYTYKPEKEFVVSGKVTNALGGPIERSNVILFASNPIIVKDTLTDNNGNFAFKGLFPVDTALFKIQGRNKNGKEMNVKIDIDQLKLPAFGRAALTIPWYFNTDTTLLNNSKAKVAETKALSDYRGEGNVLNEVNIISKKVIKDSKNLNGPGEADLIIDEEELKKADKKTLLTLIEEKIPGFNIGPFTPPKREYPPSLQLRDHLRFDFPQLPNIDGLEAKVLMRAHIPWRWGYKINTQEVHFIIDGMDLDYYYNDREEMFPNDNKRYLFVKTYLDYFTAEDITGIELMTNPKYTGNYNIDFEQNRERFTNGRLNSFAYLEITTRAKKGPFMQVTPGTYLHKTLPFTLAKQFYSPKYTVSNKTTEPGTDLRSTIFWEPNVVTDKDGKASVSFYSADKAAGYTVLIEGTDMDGGLGFGEKQIKIK